MAHVHPVCSKCGQAMELAEYLEGYEDFESAFICVECPDTHYDPCE